MIIAVPDVVTEKTFLDSAFALLHQYFEELWCATEHPHALYARGSINLPICKLMHRPWDMDFVLFVTDNETAASHMASITMRKIIESVPKLPPPDISVVRYDNTSPKCLHTLLLIAGDGNLLFGEDCRLPLAFFSKHRHAIYRYAVEISISRLALFKQCTNVVEQQKRAPHLAKSFLRLGGLLKLHQGNFTRKPEECAVWLTNMCPIVWESSTLLLQSLNTIIEPKLLADACSHILHVVNGALMNDQSMA